MSMDLRHCRVAEYMLYVLATSKRLARRKRLHMRAASAITRIAKRRRHRFTVVRDPTRRASCSLALRLRGSPESARPW